MGATMREITRDGLIDRFSQDDVGLVSCLSFEQRSLVVPELLVGRLRRWLCIVNEDIETDIGEAQRQAAALADRAGISIEFLNASKRDPVVLADSMVNAAASVFEDGLRWVADITTMTHEMLFVIVAAADEIVTPWKDLQLVYNLAAQYS